MIVKSYGGRWIISAEEQGEIQVTVGQPTKYPLRRLELNKKEHQGNIDYDGVIEPWSSQDNLTLMSNLKDLFSNRSVYFSIILNSIIGDMPPFDRITKCKLYQDLQFSCLNVDWRR